MKPNEVILATPILFKINDFLNSIIKLGIIIKVVDIIPIVAIIGNEPINCCDPIIKYKTPKNNGNPNKQIIPTKLFKKYLFSNFNIAHITINFI